MPGKRTTKDDLSAFTYLDREPDGRFTIRHPVTKRRASLKTRDLDKAISRYSVIMSRWQADDGDDVANSLAQKMQAISETPAAAGHCPTVAAFAAYWRMQWLGVQIAETARGKRGKSKYVQGACRTISENTRKHLSPRTALDYAIFCDRFFESDPILQTLKLNQRNAAQEMRRALSKYNDKPTSYNHHLACLITMLQQAKRDGHIHGNWAREIDQLVKPKKSAEDKRQNHIHPDDYFNIREQLVDFSYMGRKRDGEWLGRTCDLILCMSSRPTDAISLRDDAFDDQGRLLYRTGKTDQLIEIEDAAGTLAETVKWFRQWKKYNHIISPLLIVFPAYFSKDWAGKPVSTRYISRKFSEAVVAAGYPKGRWVLRNLRHTGISTEEQQQGPGANKGGHRSRTGMDPYLTSEPVTRVKNTITLDHKDN